MAVRLKGTLDGIPAALKHLREKGEMNMRSISKAMIAVMIAAAMCAVPLFVIEDADAATVTTGEKALSVEASDVTTADFDRLFSDLVKGVVILVPLDIEIDASDVTFSEVTFKEGIAMKVDEDKTYGVSGSYIKAKIAYQKDLTTPVQMFPLTAGLEELYDYLGTNIAATGKNLKVEGTIEMGNNSNETANFFITNENKIADDTTTTVRSSFYKANYTVTYNNGSSVKSFDVEVSGKENTTTTETVKYLIEDKKNAINATEVLVSSTIDNKVEKSGTYKFDGKTASYEAKDVPQSVEGTFVKGTAVSHLSSENLAPVDILYYSEDGPALFSSPYAVEDATLRDNTAMKTFLESIGSVSDSYSTAKSIADSGSADVSAGGSGGSNIIFYVIIGVLAVAVVALAVILIKKK